VFCTSSAAGRARVLALNTTCRGRGVGVAIREGDFHLLRSAGGFAFPPVVPLQLPISWPRCRRSENRISLQHRLHRSLPGREESWALIASTHTWWSLPLVLGLASMCAVAATYDSAARYMDRTGAFWGWWSLPLASWCIVLCFLTIAWPVANRYIGRDFADLLWW
jgi:hypothetical protein